MFDSSDDEEEKNEKKKKSKEKSGDDDDVISLLEDTDEDDDITLLSSSPSKKRKRTSMGSRSTKMLEKLERERKIARVKEAEALRLEREASKEEEADITIEKKEEEVEEEEEEGERIALKVRYDTKNIETYKVKPGDPFSVLMNRILKSQKKTKITIRCDGEEVRPSDTAEDLDLEDDDQLDVIVG